jgi:hypothetical protein
MFEETPSMSVIAVDDIVFAPHGGASDSGVAGPAIGTGRATRSETELTDGSLLAGRYRILYRISRGWAAYDERLTRPVVAERLAGTGTPAEQIRLEAAMDEGLCDAVVVGDEAFAIRTTIAR